jgi:hypothetical protein
MLDLNQINFFSKHEFQLYYLPQQLILESHWIFTTDKSKNIKNQWTLKLLVKSSSVWRTLNYIN